MLATCFVAVEQRAATLMARDSAAVTGGIISTSYSLAGPFRPLHRTLGWMTTSNISEWLTRRGTGASGESSRAARSSRSAMPPGGRK